MAKETNFTLRRLEDAEYQGDKANFFLYDSKVPGLRLKITKKGVKTFQFYKWGSKRGVPITITIGRFDGSNLDGARKEAQKYSNDLLAGIDIQGEKVKQRKEKDFDFYAQKYFESQRQHGKRDIDCTIGRYKNHVKPFFGKKKLSWFTQAKIEAWFHDLLERQSVRSKNKVEYLSKTSANRLLEIVVSVFSQNSIPHYIGNPAANIKAFREYSRSRYIHPDELQKLLKNLKCRTPNFRDIFKLALYTGARKGNLLSMRWQDIDFSSQTWTIPGENSKNHEAMVVPLLPDAMELLERRRQEQHNDSTISAFVFPSDSGSGHISDPKRQWAQLKKDAGITDNLRFHDIRRSVGSYLAQSGQPLNVIGSLLGHRDLKTTEVYARLNSKSTAKSLEIGFKHMMQQAEESEEKQKIVNIREAQE